jgi:predicted negative regulator of RcsB-dependent stress response
MTYKTFMIIGVIVVAAGWIAYAIWDYKQRQEEKKQPPKKSERLQKTQSEIADWAKQMAQFKKPTRKPEAPDADQNKE